MSEISTEHLTREDCEREAACWQTRSAMDYAHSQRFDVDVSAWQAFQRDASATARRYLWAAIEKRRNEAT